MHSNVKIFFCVLGSDLQLWDKNGVIFLLSEICLSFLLFS